MQPAAKSVLSIYLANNVSPPMVTPETATHSSAWPKWQLVATCIVAPIKWPQVWHKHSQCCLRLSKSGTTGADLSSHSSAYKGVQAWPWWQLVLVHSIMLPSISNPAQWPPIAQNFTAPTKQPQARHKWRLNLASPPKRLQNQHSWWLAFDHTREQLNQL